MSDKDVCNSCGQQLVKTCGVCMEDYRGDLKKHVSESMRHKNMKELLKSLKSVDDNEVSSLLNKYNKKLLKPRKK